MEHSTSTSSTSDNPKIESFLKKTFSISLLRNILLDNKQFKIDNFLEYFTKFPGKKTLCELSIDYYRHLYENSQSNSLVSMHRYLATENKVMHESIIEYPLIEIVDGDFQLNDNNWYYLPYDSKLGETFLSNNLTQEDLIFTTSPEIPHLIFTYASHASKFLNRSEVVLFENISNVSVLDSELTSFPELSVDPDFNWAKKISRNDSHNNNFNLIVSSMIRLKKSRMYTKDEFRYQLFKAYISFLAAKKHGATEIHFGGKYLEDHVGKKRAILSAIFFAASLAGIKKIHFYAKYGLVDRADEIIQHYGEFPFDRIIGPLSNNSYGEDILLPNNEAVWQWYSWENKSWINYPPYISQVLEKKSISESSIEIDIENGKHVVDFDKNISRILSKGQVLKMRRLVFEN